jgi:hypothetical protein
MATFARQVLNALLPRGSAWAPKYDGGFDHLLDGISDCFQVLRAVGGALADLRHPMTTQQLEDLEREFGVIGDTTTAEAVRRIYLHGVVYGDIGTGSEDNLELRLRAAGFDVRVHPNNPMTDPLLLLSSIPHSTCSVTPGSLSTCSLVAAATCSRSDSGSNSLLVNETLERAPVVYLLPSDYRYWSAIFFVGGEMTGADFFLDWDMEMPHTAHWPGSGGASVSKYLPLHNSGIRSLMVAADGTIDLNDQRIQPDTTIATLASFYRMAYDGGFAMQLSGISPVEVEEISPNGTIHFCTSKDTYWYGVGPTNHCGGLGFETSYPDVIVDGDMEAVGVADWTVGAAVMSKVGSAHSGSQCGRITANAGVGAQFPQIYQDIATAGKSYLITGYARSDGTQIPKITWNLNPALWTGTSATTWQNFSLVSTATDPRIKFYHSVTNPAGTEYVEFDDITVYDLTDGCYVDLRQDLAVNGEFTTTDDWTLGGADWEITGGRLVHTAGAATTDAVQNVAGQIRTGGLFRVVYEVESYSGAGNHEVFLCTQSCGVNTGNGVFEAFVLEASGGAAPFIQIVADLTCNCAIKWITVELVDQCFSYPELTIAAWVKVYGDLCPVQGIVSNGATGAFQQSLWYDKTNNEWAWTVDVGGVAKTISTPATVDQWTLLVATRSDDGADTTLNLYVDGVLAATQTFVGVQVLAEFHSPVIGVHAPGGFLYGEISDNVQMFSDVRDAVWVAAEYIRGMDVIDTGPKVEQMLAEPVSDARELSISVWADGTRFYPSVALVQVCDYNGVWDHFGALGTISDVNATLTVDCPNGVSGVRLISKFTPDGYCLFDDVRFDDIVISRAQVPANLRDKFERLILAGKPVHSWAGLLIDYV